MPEEKAAIIKVTAVHPLGTMDICTKFHCNPFSSYVDISVKVQMVKLVVLEVKSGNHQSQYDSSSGDHECLYKLHGNSIVDEIFKSGPK